ncbi:hypothetical protein BJ742DRAFT_784544, partial [Cladochytrium replicatum]
MKSTAIFVAVAALAATAQAVVPQEHSHDITINAFRKFNKADVDPIFGPLGAQVAGENAAKSKDANIRNGGESCLQQNLADLAIAGCGNDKTCLKVSLQYRVLERNTGGVGVLSKDCATAPKSALLSTLKQYQDINNAASAARNSGIELALMKVLVESVGLSADEAATAVLETATFGKQKGNGNTNGRGASCDGPTSANRDFETDKANFGKAVTAPQAFTDPVTGLSFKAGDAIDCITLADFQLPGTEFGRNPQNSRAQLIASVGNGGNANSGGNNGGNDNNNNGNN